MVVKKYGNRRLYDTTESRYITLEELAERVRAGETVQVLDAKTNKDLTQQTLAHLILESRGASKLLPVPLLEQLIRMGDDSLSEFLGMYLSGALEVYMTARRSAQAMLPYGGYPQGGYPQGGYPQGGFPQGPFAQLPAAATNAFARLLGGWAPSAWTQPGWSGQPWSGPPWSGWPGGAPSGGPAAPEPPAEPPPRERPPPARASKKRAAAADDTADQMAALRKELEAIKKAMRSSDE